jgi:hypothetical protein
MNRYNELKLQVLSLFAATQGDGSDQMKRRKSWISSQLGQPGLISKGCGHLVFWKGVPEIEVLWNIGLANWGDRVFVGYARKGTNSDCALTGCGPSSTRCSWRVT